MENSKLNNKLFQHLSSAEMKNIVGAEKKLHYVECTKDCTTGQIETTRHYEHYNLKGIVVKTSVGKDKKGDELICDCNLQQINASLFQLRP